jgi:hypothetical protein
LLKWSFLKHRLACNAGCLPEISLPGMWATSETLAVAGGGPEIWQSAVKGSVYVEFDVPANSLVGGGGPGIFSILGPNAGASQMFQLPLGGEFHQHTKILHKF